MHVVRDLMEPRVISVDPAMPLLSVHRLFVEEQISGVPVLEDDGTLVGVITGMDLLRAVEDEYDTRVAQIDYFRDVLPYSTPDWTGAPEELQLHLADRRADEAMTRRVLTIEPDAPVAEAARILREHRIHRLIVTERGRLVGILTAFDLLALVEKLA